MNRKIIASFMVSAGLIFAATAFAQSEGTGNDQGAMHAELSSMLTGRTAEATTSSSEKQQIRRENLITNSPFRVVRWRGRDAATRQPLELHGFAGSGDKMEVSLTNPDTRECYWVRLRDDNAKWYVESADPKSRTVVVRLDGMSINLEMVKASETPLPTASRFIQPAVTIQAAQPAAQPRQNTPPQQPQQNQQQQQQRRQR